MHNIQSLSDTPQASTDRVGTSLPPSTLPRSSTRNALPTPHHQKQTTCSSLHTHPYTQSALCRYTLTYL
jgi:hypothetical protein